MLTAVIIFPERGKISLRENRNWVDIPGQKKKKKNGTRKAEQKHKNRKHNTYLSSRERGAQLVDLLSHLSNF